jgi:uncharacterized protein (DUF433 family)
MRLTLSVRQREQIAKAYASGSRPMEIAEEYGISRAAVNVIAKRRGIPPHNPRVSEAKQGLKTFAPQHVKEIEELRQAGWNPTRIAKHFGVARDTVLRAIDPAYRARRNAQIASNKGYGYADHRRIIHSVLSQGTERSVARDAERLLASVPDDTRCLTARTFGDPIFERSALYAKQKGNSNAAHS